MPDRKCRIWALSEWEQSGEDLHFCIATLIARPASHISLAHPKQSTPLNSTCSQPVAEVKNPGHFRGPYVTLPGDYRKPCCSRAVNLVELFSFLAQGVGFMEVRVPGWRKLNVRWMLMHVARG